MPLDPEELACVGSCIQIRPGVCTCEEAAAGMYWMAGTGLFVAVVLWAVLVLAPMLCAGVSV